MRNLLCMVLAWLLCAVLVAEARFVQLWYNPLTAAVQPFQGLGDVLTNVIVSHSTSCYANNNLTSPVAVIKDVATGATSTTLGCVGPIGARSSVPIVTAGSALATTCAGVAGSCYVDTLNDQSTGANCSLAACDLTQTVITGSRGRFINPSYVLNCAPNGTSACLHFQGWADGSSGNNANAVTSGTYNNATGVVVLTTAVTNYYLAGGTVHTAGLTGGPSGVAGDFVVTAATSNTITYNAGAGLGTCFSSCISAGSYIPNIESLNNNTGTFLSVNEPYTVAVLMTCDGYQNAGTSGGPNSAHANSDSKIKVGCNTTPGATGVTTPPTLMMYNGNTPITVCSSGCTITQSISYGTFYSLVAEFNGANSWFCINGVCNGGSGSPISLGGSTVWALPTANVNDGYSIGNGSGGWGGKWLEGALASGAQHSAAAIIYANEKATFGNF